VAAGDTPRASAELVAQIVRAVGAGHEPDAEALDLIVVGVPKRLNGEETGQTQAAREFAAALHTCSGVTVHAQDERLSSHEADRLLAVRERDWRRRKEKLDAASAAVILQDYLDWHARSRT